MNLAIVVTHPYFPPESPQPLQEVYCGTTRQECDAYNAAQTKSVSLALMILVSMLIVVGVGMYLDWRKSRSLPKAQQEEGR